MEAFQSRFTHELMKEIIPFVEKNYRVVQGKNNRALAGLSMGGGQTLRVITTHPDQFGYVGIWSAGLFGGNAEEWAKRNADFLDHPGKLNDSVKLLSISIGDKDFLVNATRSLEEVLDKHGIKHESHTSSGGHTWINWRHYLHDFAPRLFQ
jgi:enterochelin esterase family protein